MWRVSFHVFLIVLFFFSSENQFNFSLHLLESKLNMDGQYSVLDSGTTSGDIQAEILLPSGDSISSNLSLSYVKMENEYLLVVSEWDFLFLVVDEAHLFMDI